MDAADSMRTAILHAPVPVIAFIDMQAASAGALISIACDSIYMRSGSIRISIVVNQNGEVMPDKYQSFMRGMMRSTAEAHGRRSDGSWFRDPAIAEKMVDTAGVLSFTPDEAIEAGYCEGKAESIDEVISIMELDDCEIVHQQLSWIERFILMMLSPVLQGIFLMMIVGGIYFEVQSPGLGLPSVIALLGAVLYFSPAVYLRSGSQLGDNTLRSGSHTACRGDIRHTRFRSGRSNRSDTDPHLAYFRHD